MLAKIFIALQYLLPKHTLTRLVGLLAEGEHGRLTTWLIKLFIKQYKVNMAEAELPQAEDYASFNAFFTRALKADARPIDSDDQQLACPVDGAISQIAAIEADSLIQAKGHNYSLTALLGGKAELAEHFHNGQFTTIYLSPTDYHRIHMPCTGTLTDMVYVPGDLFSVNQTTVANVPNLFARNERVVALFDTDLGKMAMVLVGATIVGSIETVWAGCVTPPAGKHLVHWRYDHAQQAPIVLTKGAEMGRFKLGSTVILCFAEDAIQFADLTTDDTVRLGQTLAHKA